MFTRVLLFGGRHLEIFLFFVVSYVIAISYWHLITFPYRPQEATPGSHIWKVE